MPAKLDISVLMATWNRATRLEQTLHHFARLNTYGLSWELIIIANGCTDATQEVVTRFAKVLPIVALKEAEAGKTRALNRGLAVARGDLLVLTDDDIIPDRNWLQEWVAAARRWPDDSVFGGRIDPLFPPDVPAWIAHPSFPFTVVAFARYVPADQEGPVDHAPLGPNQAVRRVAMQGVWYCESIGPREKSFALGDDTELMRRLHSKGYRYIYVPTTGVQHPIEPHQLTLTWLFGRAYRFGRGYARLDTHSDCPYLFGVPRYLWRRRVEYGLKHALRRFGTDERRFQTGYPLAVVRGMIHEYRVMAAEGLELQPAADSHTASLTEQAKS
jgi:glycosyltransferase involved in cell wall biosynthesis